MTDVQERRDRGTQRVPVSTLVEICGNEPGNSVFEAQSLDVSARGMHLRTAYLPADGTPLVCRFENEGKEIVVEGRVAWRREGSRGGEFGVQFTALDSRSVAALSGLCDAPEGASRALESEALGEPGARVRLHIEGLGSPMKARVKAGTGKKVQVGSSLEFLKVGRRLEIEDLEQGERRSAQIDSVSVLVDPSTQVPQLIVALRYAGVEDTTPSPSVAEVDTGERAKARSLRIPAEAVTTQASERASGVDSADSSAQAKVKTTDKATAAANEDEPALRGRVATLAAGAEVRAKAAGEMLARASGHAAAWVRGAAERLGTLREKPRILRRSTSPMPSVGSSEKHKLRPQSASIVDASSGRKAGYVWTRRSMGLAGAAGVLALTLLVLALRGPSSAPPGARESASNTAVATAVVGSALPSALPPAPGGAVTANVPLFGPTPLTTTEPAPLGPPANDGSEAAQEFAASKASVGARTPDESWPEEENDATGAAMNGRKPANGASSSNAAGAKPEDVSPWGRGRLNSPTIHRLRLDGPGAALQGAVEPTGFTITVPDRKVMEAAAGIAKRDERIARVRASNSGSGAQISFRFKDGVPAYRVRLRRDYVEFLISAPDKPQASQRAIKASKPSAESSSKSKSANKSGAAR